MRSKKRLLFVLHSLTVGGTERLVLQMARCLKEQYDIAICCLDTRGEMWEECSLEGYRTYFIGRKPGWHLSTFHSVFSCFRDFKPDIIHAHQYTPFFYSALGKLFCARKARLVFTEHGRHYPDLVSSKRKMVNKLLLQQVICN